MKLCPKCEEVKEDNLFSKRYGKYDKGRLQSWCKSCTSKSSGRWEKKNKPVVRAASKRHYYKDVKRSRRMVKARKNLARARVYEKNRSDNDIDFKLRKRLRCRLHSVVSGRSKVGSAVRDLGCTLPELRLHLEKGFYPNPDTGEIMSWENYGLWHIDHIIPLSKFDLTDREQLLRACHYTNLQPLWALDNLIKSDRQDWERAA